MRTFRSRSDSSGTRYGVQSVAGSTAFAARTTSTRNGEDLPVAPTARTSPPAPPLPPGGPSSAFSSGSSPRSFVTVTAWAAIGSHSDRPRRSIRSAVAGSLAASFLMREKSTPSGAIGMVSRLQRCQSAFTGRFGSSQRPAAGPASSRAAAVADSESKTPTTASFDIGGQS